MSDIRLDMSLDVGQLAGERVLSGAPSGRYLYGQLVAALPAEPVSPEPLLLDFRAVDVATASYLRESALAFRQFVRGRKSNFYPVVANARDVIIDDLLEVVHARGDVIMVCWSDEDGVVLRWQPLGKLDPMQQLTFDLVLRLGETTASRLAESEGGTVKITAWNNRLASLSNLGLISECSRGRTKLYKPLFNGGSDGS